MLHDAIFVATGNAVLLLRDVNLATRELLCLLHSADAFLYMYFENCSRIYNFSKVELHCTLQRIASCNMALNQTVYCVVVVICKIHIWPPQSFFEIPHSWPTNSRFSFCMPRLPLWNSSVWFAGRWYKYHDPISLSSCCQRIAGIATIFDGSRCRSLARCSLSVSQSDGMKIVNK